jgi:phosphatidylserine/phosphatidylglycerophosphate/cardiolipin synthase-like enzyme
MDKISIVKQGDISLISVRAYKGDAMTLLAFDLHESLLENFVGFTIQVKQGSRSPYYLLNRLSFKPDILNLNHINEYEQKSTLYSPIQKFLWLHVPSTQHYVNDSVWGDYTYNITPRFLVNNILKPPDPALTASVTIDVSPFRKGDIQVGFTRAFVSSEAYQDYFGGNTKFRPDDDQLTFDIRTSSGTARRWNLTHTQYKDTPYTFEDQHKYLGWQARDRVLEFLVEAVNNKTIHLDVFAYDLDEPVIVNSLIELAKQNRVRIILDNSKDHCKDGCFEQKFEQLFDTIPLDKKAIFRGRYKSLAHSKVFIQRIDGKAVKVLTGSTNFSVNGFCVNANHVIIYNNETVAQSYANVFEASFGKDLMDKFSETDLARTDYCFNSPQPCDMTIRFSPHPQEIVEKTFNSISARILAAKSDVLFAIMNDHSKSDILAAVHSQVQNDQVFTYGVVDYANDVSLYKPGSKRGVRVSGKGTETVLPYPFNNIPKVPSISIHHKFIVVDFKGKESVVFCGSSNLAYNPEQKNGDNLIEIRDDDVVTAFAIEALRLTDHFAWRNKQKTAVKDMTPLNLNDNTDPARIWYKSYYDPQDLHFVERTLLIAEKKKE